MPLDHDLRSAILKGEGYFTFLKDYRSGGTPWFTIIDPEGNVIFADVPLDTGHFLKTLGADTVGLNAV